MNKRKHRAGIAPAAKGRRRAVTSRHQAFALRQNPFLLSTLCASASVREPFPLRFLDSWKKVARIIPALAAGVLIASCGLVPEKISWSDPEVAPLIRAMDESGRIALGFTPVEPSAGIRIQRHASGVYNVMLHIFGSTSRTLAFRKTPAGFEWIHEQEIYSGPKTYTTVDGTFNEQITVTYETAPVSGHNDGKVHIEYSGEDPRLSGAGRNELTWEQVRPVLAEWRKTGG